MPHSEYLRSIVATTTDGYWEVDATGHIVEFNQQCLKIYGYDAHELRQKTVADFEATRDPGQTAEHIRQIRAVGYARFETRHRRKDGRVIDVEVSTAFHGETSRYLTFLRDITERKRMEAELRESQERYQAVIETFFDGCVVHQQGKVVVANRAFAATLGYEPDELVGLSYSAVIRQSDDKQGGSHDSAIPDAVAKATGLRKDGSEVVVEVADCTCRLNGEAAKIVVVRDLSERIRAQEESRRLRAQLDHAQRMESVGNLASGIAHDLNNILTPIVTIADTLRDRPTDAGERELLEIVRTNALRGADIIRQLLISCRTQKCEKSVIDARVAISDAVNLMRETFPRNIEFSVELSPELWLIYANAAQVHQILLNLAVNARDAMPDGGRLKVVVSNRALRAASGTGEGAVKRWIELVVSDTGFGIPLEVRDRIFDPFFTTKPPGKGTGLGLSTVLGIVQDHGGTITVDSRPNQGTAITVALPAAAADFETTEGAAPEVRGAPIPPGSNQRVVVVADDEPHMLLAMRLLLKKHGYRVVEACDGEQALQCCREYRGELQAVVTDLMMPRMGGIELVRALREAQIDTNIVLMSGVVDVVPSRLLQDLGVGNILLKPFEPVRLLSAIRRDAVPGALREGP